MAWIVGEPQYISFCQKDKQSQHTFAFSALQQSTIFHKERKRKPSFLYENIFSDVVMTTPKKKPAYDS